MNNSKIFDVIVVGSGPAGVHAAYPLVEAGVKVAMIDAANFNGNLKVKSNIPVAQSFSKGGFSNQWFGLSDFFNKKELQNCGLPVKAIQREYKEVAKQIGLETNPKLSFQGELLSKHPLFYILPLAWNYRTAKQVDKFKKRKNFTYVPQLTTQIKKAKNCLEVIADSSFHTKYVILAAGAVNTTRILLKSLNLYNKKVSLLTKPNEILMCINIKTLFARKSYGGNGQVGLLGKGNPKTFDRYFVQFYEPSPEKYPIFRLFGGNLLVADIRFPGIPSKEKYCMLRKEKNGDTLEVGFKETGIEKQIHKEAVDNLKNQLKKIGIIPFLSIKGMSNHFSDGASTLKMSRVYVADSASWEMLPSKPPTLTIMANASRVGKQVLKKLQEND